MVVPAEHALHEAIQVSPLILSDDVRRQKIENRVAKMRLSAATARKIQDVFISEMNKGIHQQPSSLQMENTYIPELLDGTEEGLYLALDLGGTNFRVVLLELAHGAPIREEVKRYYIGSELRVGSAIPLFDHLAESVSDFVISQGLQDVELPLGFTFSFPMIQHSLDVGVLVTWTKTFNCPDAVNKDAVRLLREALDRRGDTKVKVLAVLNDTTGTLVQGSTLDHNTAVGLILGTGSNACYLERADRVEHWETERHGEREVIIDIEWGAFGDNGVLDFIKTDFDRENDANSLIVNSFTDSLDGGDSNTKEILAKFGIIPDEDDIRIVQYVCEVASNRAALLVSICLASLIDRIDKEQVTIAVDGSLYKHHPRLEGWMKQYISLLCTPGRKFKLIHAEDGSGKGAALVSAIAHRLKKRLQ
ncbi:Hexokinase-2 [Acromyrmex echinatior]|uniref:Phosphotransferase n=1 Tax=Acromyrmex echinatior TaxID=103372 RepID=F4WXX5_ACREC|nr:Hexokinase-2 [Acromyrmex echinatior]